MEVISNRSSARMHTKQESKEDPAWVTSEKEAIKSHKGVLQKMKVRPKQEQKGTQMLAKDTQIIWKKENE